MSSNELKKKAEVEKMRRIEALKKELLKRNEEDAQKGKTMSTEEKAKFLKTQAERIKLD